jgi:hypothetical protein
MLNTMNWQTLQERRLRTRLMMFHKVINENIAIPTHNRKWTTQIIKSLHFTTFTECTNELCWSFWMIAFGRPHGYFSKFFLQIRILYHFWIFRFPLYTKSPLLSPSSLETPKKKRVVRCHSTPWAIKALYALFLYLWLLSRLKMHCFYVHLYPHGKPRHIQFKSYPQVSQLSWC